jgi:hypothetical protein
MQSHDAGHDHEGHGGEAGSPAHDDGQSPRHAPCAPCCAAVAIASSVRPVFQSVPASAPEILVMPAPTGIQPDALDRPPLSG